MSVEVVPAIVATRDAESEPETDIQRGATTRSIPATAVPDEAAAVRCPYCGRPFRRRRQRSLHQGIEHPDRLSDRERAAFERAAREETAALRRFRLYVLGSLILLYFLFLIVYALVA
ncbi:DUF7410 domain-containing protein [Halosolutus gelatinilyticus]|uniref:DUF7410 domain-containing protein n=1 Tax=Halosolutus gelatinilyticus TaxID=2931975 RepID=UPI001FF5BCD6|nr:hypothetical protein [Halosolutus gelatinilyticus]